MDGTVSLKNCIMMPKKSLSFKTRKDFLECGQLGLERSRVQKHHGFFLSYEGWAQKVIEIPVIVGIQRPTITSLRWQASDSPDFLPLIVAQKSGRMHVKRNGVSDGSLHFWKSLAWKGLRSWIREPSSDGHGLISRNPCGKSLSLPWIRLKYVPGIGNRILKKHYWKSLVYNHLIQQVD